MSDEVVLSTPEKALATESIDEKTAMMLSGIKPLQATMEKFLQAASVEAVYGKPVESGDKLIIPAAEVLSGIGVGMGSGGGSNEQDESQKANFGGGGGGGGGGRVFSRPVAVIIAAPERVRVEPVVDVTKIALAVFTTLGFMVGMALRMLKPSKNK